MTRPHLSLWLEEQPAQGAADADRPRATRRPRNARPAAEPDLHIEFLDADRNPIGKPMRAAIPKPIRAEVPGGDGGFKWVDMRPPLSLADVSPAQGAVSLRARLAGRVLAEHPLHAALAPSPGPPFARRSSNPTGRWKVILVSERFDTPEAFFAAYETLRDFILGSEPFQDPAVRAAFQIEALFWPSGPAGLFNTVVNGRLVTGDNDRVRRFVDSSGSTGRLTMVLVNLSIRGGAGGTRERPAWVTTTSDSNERWEAVALHELGHSFGLADEYTDSSQTTPEPNPLEPNVTKEKNAASAPWAALRTPGLSHNPTRDAQGQPAVPDGTIGTFEGARYKPRRRYRATADCLMRATNRPFCVICQNHIKRVLSD